MVWLLVFSSFLDVVYVCSRKNLNYDLMLLSPYFKFEHTLEDNQRGPAMTQNGDCTGFARPCLLV